MHYPRFLSLFEDNKGKGNKDSLKFAKGFTVKVQIDNETSVGTKEDMFPMGMILEHYGQRVGDFESMEKATEAVRHLCKKNASSHGYDQEAWHEQLDPDFPQFSKFWFVFSKAKETTDVQRTSKELIGKSDVKTVGQLENTKVFLEGMGWSEPLNGEGPKIENVKFEELQKKVGELKFF